MDKSIIKTEIIEFITDKLDDQKEILQDISQDIVEYIDKKLQKHSHQYLEEYFVNMLKESDKIMLNIYILQMDIYLLSRIFRKNFNNPVNQPDNNYNVVIYAGDAHAENYREFLSNLGFTTLATDNRYRDYLQCLDLKNVIQPFFRGPQVYEERKEIMKKEAEKLKKLNEEWKNRKNALIYNNSDDIEVKKIIRGEKESKKVNVGFSKFFGR